MSIEVLEVKTTGDKEMVVTIAATKSRSESQEGEARKLAIATCTPYIGRCGFDKLGSWGYRNPPDSMHPEGQTLTEEEMMTPGVLKVGGTFLQELKIKGGI